jgi:hypothetical protein
MTPRQKKNRLLLLAIFALGFLPFISAWYLSLNKSLLASRHTTNKGDLITPPITSQRSDFTALDTASIPKLADLPGRWLIANVLPTADCGAVCLKAILQTRQLHLMLNKDMLRTRRIVLAWQAPNAEATQQLAVKEALMWRLLDKAGKDEASVKTDALLYDNLLNPDKMLDEALMGRLIGQDTREAALQSGLVWVKPSDNLQHRIAQLKNNVIPDGMLLLIDPFGNIMMQYAPGFDPYKVKSDLMHLLRISQIG